jgi:hypothetical protein
MTSTTAGEVTAPNDLGAGTIAPGPKRTSALASETSARIARWPLRLWRRFVARFVARFVPVLLPLAVACGLLALLLPIATARLIDGDEGYLLMAARLLSEGKLPYRDFFLPQGPVLPALFAVYFLGVGRSWLAARILAGAIAILLGLLVYHETRATTRRRSAAVLAVALYAFSGQTIGWLTIVKGYGVSALCALGGLVLVRMAVPPSWNSHGRRRRDWLAVAAGLCLGLATSARLYLVLLAPMVALYVLLRLGRTRLAMRCLGLLALGGAVGTLPLLAGYLLSGRAFVFDTVIFHSVREFGQSSALGSFDKKWPALLKGFGVDGKATMGDRQLMGLAIAAVLALLARAFSRRRHDSAAAYAWPALLVGSALPNPFHPQYLCMLVPFFAIEVGLLLDLLLDRCARARSIVPAAVVIAGTLGYLGYHVTVGGVERDRFVYTGWKVPGVWSRDRAVRWRLETIEAVAREIDDRGRRVAASWWPGYFVSTDTAIELTLANDFGLRAAEALSPQERARIHVVSLADVGTMIASRTPRLFVEGNWAARPWADWLPRYGYQVRSQVANVRLWTVP